MGVWAKFVNQITLRDENGQPMNRWINDDIRPLPPSRRTWTGLTFFSYQGSVGLIIVTWSAGSSLLALGLNAWQAIIGVIIGYSLVGIITMLGSEIGGTWHIGFPVANRFVWGMNGFIFPSINRIVLDMVWWATESWLGMMCTKATLGALWPSIYTIPNTFPDYVPMTTSDFTAWAVFVVLCVAGLFLRPERYHWPSLVTGACNLVVSLALVGWFTHRASGAGVLFKSTESLAGVTPATGSSLGWAFMHGITLVISSQATGTLGFADWGRYAKTPSAQRYPQGLGMGLSDMLSGIFGIICASCCATIYPESGLVWNQALLLTQIQMHESSAARAAVFFASLPILVSQLLITVAASSVAVGIDLAGVVPRYINLFRGGVITVIIGILMQPWQLSNTNNKFISVLGSYAVFIAPLTGILHCDYFLVRRRRISLEDLYNPEQSSYRFWHGINFRAVISFCLGFFVFLPGYINNITPEIEVAKEWKYMFYMCYPLGYAIAGTSHYTINYFFPPADLYKVDEYDHFGTFSVDEKTPFGVIPGVSSVVEAVDVAESGRADSSDRHSALKSVVKS